MPESLLILGASTRAAAVSALRAGLRPRCVDLFADADLQALCPAQRLSGKYPWAFVEVIDDAIPGPWLYTGGLENYPHLVQRLAQRRPLWGNDGPVLRRARDPETLVQVARQCGLPTPRLGGGSSGRWLIKPRRGAGGFGIRFWHGEAVPRGCYLQEFLEGEPVSAVFVGPRLIGMTRQLIGVSWLAATGFRYCGNVGPIPSMPGVRELGEQLVATLGLRGVFGIDGIARDGVFWPLEVNPRYTASVEVLERTLGVAVLSYPLTPYPSPQRGEGSTSGYPLPGREGSDTGRLGEDYPLTPYPSPQRGEESTSGYPLPGREGSTSGYPLPGREGRTSGYPLPGSGGSDTGSPLPWGRGVRGEGDPPSEETDRGAVATPSLAKGILFARRRLCFPASGPWLVHKNDFADLPHPFQLIEPGQPILTLFAPNLDELHRRADEIETWLYADQREANHDAE